MKRRLPTNDWHSVLYANPVVLVSTRSPDGVDNVAPYGMCMPVSTDPPLLALGVRPDRQTWGYIRASGQFAVNLLAPALKRACVAAAAPLPPEQSEFDYAGLERQPAAEIAVALVGPSPANLECRLEWMRPAGDHDIIVGRIVAIWIRDALYAEDPERMRLNIDGFYRVGAHYFGRGPEIA